MQMLRPIFINKSCKILLQFIDKKCSSYYTATPIFYANSSPHIGHLHTLLLADATNLYQRLKLQSSDTILSTGTDEHGIKIQSAADAAELDYLQFCNKNSGKFLQLTKQYDIGTTDFIRTTEDRHKVAVKDVWNKLQSQGLIYKSKYAGWYCRNDETFVSSLDVSEKEVDGQKVIVDQNNNLLEWSEEENYMFKLSEFQDKIIDWLKAQKPVTPGKFNSEAIRMLEVSSLGDISVSRPCQRLKWGIGVPGDPSHTIYVWLDALTSYLTVANYPNDVEKLKRWPVDCHIIGKDILKFHAIYWPAFLMGLSLPLPEKLICHSHWLVDSIKMSKSLGNVVDPFLESKILTSEGLRYYLLRASTPHSDTDYNRTQAIARINSELSNTYFNLLSRSSSSNINPHRTIPTQFTGNPVKEVLEITDNLNELADDCQRHYETCDFYKSVDSIISTLKLCQILYQDSQPWKLVKEIDSNTAAYEKYTNLQTITFETLRVCSIILQPIIPKLSSLVLDKLSVNDRLWVDAKSSISFGDPKTSTRPIARSDAIFPKLKLEINGDK